MRGICTPLSVGNTVELGDPHDVTVESAGGTTFVVGTSDEDTDEYVISRTMYEGGESFDIHSDSVVLGVEKDSLRLNPTLWFAIPKTAYGGSQ